MMFKSAAAAIGPGGASGAGTILIPRTGTALTRTGWTVSASRSFGTTPPTNATDGNTGTVWTTGGSINTATDFYKIDLGSAQTVGGIQLNFTGVLGDAPKAGHVQYSDDNSTWTTINAWTSANTGYNSSTSLTYVNLSWTPVSHRYWRVIPDDLAIGASGNWWSISEINLYSDNAPWMLKAAVNYTASGGFLYAPTDGNSSTVWQNGRSPIAGTDWFQVDLGVATTVGSFKIDDTASWTGDLPVAGDIQYSDDASAWTVIASWTTSDIVSGVLTRSWTPDSHRYWRLLAQGIANGGGSNFWSINDLLLYADAH